MSLHMRQMRNCHIMPVIYYALSISVAKLFYGRNGLDRQNILQKLHCSNTETPFSSQHWSRGHFLLLFYAGIHYLQIEKPGNGIFREGCVGYITTWQVTIEFTTKSYGFENNTWYPPQIIGSVPDGVIEIICQGERSFVTTWTCSCNNRNRFNNVT